MTATLDVVDAITEPGVYTIPDAIYHADPVPGGSLSSTGARRLLSASPAHFDHERRNGRTLTRAFSFGHAAHELVLGIGGGIVEVDADSWRTNDAKAQRDLAYAEGKTPLLPPDAQIVRDMAAAIRRHPLASALLDPANGEPEQSIFWQDQATGVTRRCRLDWLPNHRPGRRTIIPDYKTAVSAHPEDFRKAAANYGYHMQDDWYTDAVRAVRRDTDIAFVFIVQEKTAPYVVSVVQLTETARHLGHRQNRRAIDTYADCTRTGHWPGYSDDVIAVDLPRWYETQTEQDLAS